MRRALRPPRARRLAVVVGLALPVLAARASAQQRDSAIVAEPPAATPGAVTTLRIAAGLAVTAAAIAPFDVAITKRLRAQRDRMHPRRLYLLAVAGSLGHNRTMSDIGIHVSESYAAAAVAVYLAKGVAGRARPYTVNSESAYDFEFGRGFPHKEPYSSFPSGHATGSFAFAASITVEAARRWPEHAVLVGSLAYGGAFLDGVSRVYRDTHWPSDVAAGALIGTVSGILVTRHQHAHPDNRVDALARRMLFAPAADGRMLVGVARTF